MFYVGIPTLNCYDLLFQCIESCFASTEIPKRIYVIDNGGNCPQHIRPDVQIVRQEKNLGVAASWNKILEVTMPISTFILNDDILMYPDAFERMMASEGSFVTSRSGYNAFLMRDACWRHTGRFDEGFEIAYYEDSDHWYRMKLNGEDQRIVDMDARQQNGGPSRTKWRMSEEDRVNIVDYYQNRNRERYIRKWGGEPGQETFTIPFNTSDNPCGNNS